MIYFAYTDIITAIFAFSSFGMLSGGIHKSFLIILTGFADTLKILPRAFRRDAFRTFKNHTLKTYNKKTPVAKNISDFFFFGTVSLIYVFVTYIFLDGVFRLYTFIFFILGFWISSKTLNVFFETLLLLLFKSVYKITFFMIYVLLFPLIKLLHLTISFITPILHTAKEKHLMHKSQKILLHKKRKISSAFVDNYI